MASTIRFSDESKWVGNNAVFWTLMRYLHKNMANHPRASVTIEYPVESTIQFCDFRPFTEEDLKEIRRLAVQLRDEDFADEWQYDLPADEWKGRLDDIIARIDKRIEELAQAR